MRAPSRFVLGLSVSLLFALAAPSLASATPLSFTFDSNSQGWKAAQSGAEFPAYFDPWSSSAGNPGGGLAVTDTGVG